MSAFLVNGELITDKNKIRNMWAYHFEALCTLSSNTNYDNNFFDKVTTSVKEISSLVSGTLLAFYLNHSLTKKLLRCAQI